MKKITLLIIILITTGLQAQVVSMVKDVFSGSNSGFITVGDPTFPRSSIVFNNKLIFVGMFSTTQSAQLWESDGTAAGTLLLKQITSSSSGAYPIGFTPYNTPLGPRIFFSANNSLNGENYELWRTDGTAAGTVLTADIYTGGGTSSSSNPQRFTEYDNKLYFAATVPPSLGMELFVTTGTSMSTSLVKDFNIGTGDSQPKYFKVANNTLFYSANNGNGRKIYATTGTAANQTILIDPCTASTGSDAFSIVAFNNKAYYSAINCVSGLWRIWQSDGTVDDTTPLVDIAGLDGNSYPADLVVSQGRLFFSAYTSGNGREICYIDSNNQSSSFRSINPGSGDGVAFGNQYIEYNNALYFIANDGTSGNELWKIDLSIPSPNDVVRVKDINPSIASSNPNSFIVFGGKLYFQANDGTHGAELWQTDGTEAGTVMTADINMGSAGSLPSDFNILNSTTLLFGATTVAAGTELWKLDISSLSNADVDFSSSIQLYPNPANSQINVRAEQGIVISAVSVTDINGRIITQRAFENLADVQLDIADLSAGIYMMKITSSAGVSTQKFIKN